MNIGLVLFTLLSCCFLVIYLPGCLGEKSLHPPAILAKNLSSGMEQFEIERKQMVEEQIRGCGIQDEGVLAAMSQVPRHQFVNAPWKNLAYSDRPLPIAHQQTISQPYIVAYMSEAAEIDSQDKVLEIGTGCGYQAAVLGEIAQKVYSIEIIPELAQRARQTLAQLGYKNIQLKTGDGYKGWAEYAP